MAQTFFEKRMNILIELSTLSPEPLPDQMLEDRLVIDDFWKSIPELATLKKMFLERLTTKQLVDLFSQNLFSVHDLITFYTDNAISNPRIAEFLKNIDIDSRNFLFGELTRKDPDRFKGLERLTYTQLAMVAGIWLQDISKEASLPDATIEQLNELMSEPLKSIESLKERLFFASKSTDYEAFVLSLIASYEADFDPKSPITDKDTFTRLLKLAYILYAGQGDTYDTPKNALFLRLLSHVCQYTNGADMVVILEQLPDKLATQILSEIEKGTRHKTMSMRQPYASRKAQIEAYCQQNPESSICRTIDRQNLSYSLTDPQGESPWS